MPWRRSSALVALCRCLRPELDAAERSAAARDVQADIGALAVLAEEHNLAAALWAALVRHGLIAPVPSSVRAVFDSGGLRSTRAAPTALWLEDNYRENTARNTALQVQLAEIVAALNRVDVAPVLLKGARWLQTGDDVGVRSMVDIDLLVPPSAASRANDALVAAGYLNADYPLRDTARRNTHLVPLHRPDVPASVELHVELGDWPTPEMLPASVALDESSPCPLAGDGSLTVRALSATHHVLHTILHSEIHHRAHAGGRVSLRSLHDLARARATTDPDVDWVRIRDAFARRVHVLDAFAFQLKALFGLPMPAGIARTRRARSHLRRCLITEGLPSPIAGAVEQLAVFPGTMDARRISYLYEVDGFAAVNAARVRHLYRMSRLTVTRAGRA